MFDEALRLKTLVPLVLRLAMAAIFIYHGWDKVTGERNNWGSEWANRAWEEQGKAPQGAIDKLEAMAEKEDQKALDRITSRLKTSYQEDAPTIPGSLQSQGAQMAVAWGELICGVTLLLGLFTRLSALAMIVIQVGAIVTVTAARGFSAAGGIGYEYNVVVIAVCVALALTGGGILSADRCLTSWRQRRTTTKAHEPVAVG
jgi:uncharacterized membrane protein YphA (DoxX/SURF4 family)